jgi:hypothetical protein
MNIFYQISTYLMNNINLCFVLHLTMDWIVWIDWKLQ